MTDSPTLAPSVTTSSPTIPSASPTLATDSPTLAPSVTTFSPTSAPTNTTATLAPTSAPTNTNATTTTNDDIDVALVAWVVVAPYVVAMVASVVIAAAATSSEERAKQLEQARKFVRAPFSSLRGSTAMDVGIGARPYAFVREEGGEATTETSSLLADEW